MGCTPEAIDLFIEHKTMYNISVGFCAVFHALGMDAVHDRMKLFIYFGSAPNDLLLAIV